MSVSAQIYLHIICNANSNFTGSLFRNSSGVINQLRQVYPGGAVLRVKPVVQTG